VKFKYEKLGIFCFVCGVMGHAENKCEVRYSMEHDDGVREWSAEIRADTRRQGGRLVSRWLREEKGGRSDVEGSEAAGLTRQVTGNVADVDTTQADLPSNNHSPLHNSRHPNYTPIITPFIAQTHTPIQSTNIPHDTLPLIAPGAAFNVAANNPKPKFVTSLLPSNNIIISPLLPSTNSLAVFPNNKATITSNQAFPINISQPETDPSNSQSFPNQIVTFNSQPITRVPPNNKPANQKATRAAKQIPTRTGNKPTPDPTLTRTRPDKKPKNYDLFSNPTQILIGPSPHQDAPTDHDAQGEKKRRREEETTDNRESLKETEHFLTAGPGSQACRDQ
jgi:hypothetical protein